MKKSFFIIFIFVVFLTGSICAETLPVVIIPSEPSVFEKTAATELVTHLKMICGKNIEITKENSAHKSSKRIFLGSTKRAASLGLDFTKYAPEKWLIHSLDNNTIILGGGTPRGVIYSVFEYLERNHGVIWLDENDTYVKKSPSIQT